MAMNSSPARIVRESIETPASRATGSRPCPRLPATASATCVTVHRIVASKSLLAPEFGRSVHFVRSVLLGAFSPVEGSSFVCESLPLARSLRFSHCPRERELLRAKPSSAFWRLRVAPLAERFPRFFAIVKMDRVVRENLVVLMALARQQHNISRARFFNRQMDGLCPVRFDHVFSDGFLHAYRDIADDLQRIFLPRVVARQNR